MLSNSKVSLVVGFPEVQSPRALGNLHRKFGVHQDEKFDIINGYSVDLRADQVDSYLSSLPESATAMLDKPFFPKLEPSNKRRSPGLEDAVEANPKPLPYISRPSGVEKLHSQGIQGLGSTIAFVDSGIAPHGDLKSRITYFKDFSNNRSTGALDSYGHGTHVAGIAAGDGDLIDGIAPQANLVGLRITTPSEAIKAIQWAVENKEKYDIDILNLSLGVPDRLASRQDPFAQAAQQAIDAGIITIVAAGNEGKECSDGVCHGTISSPGTLPDAITVGAYDDSGTLGLDDDKVWFKSSLGPTASDHIAKPDLVAPGVRVFGPKASGSDLSTARPTWESYLSDDGSSMATPMVSGAAALLLQIDPTFTQAEIKSLLSETATPIINTPGYAQGAGRMNLEDLVARAQARASA